MKKVLTFSLMVMILLVACKKDKKEITISLKGKWNLENIVAKDYYNGAIINTGTEPGYGATFDFQNSGSLIITYAAGSETLPYTIKPDSKVEFDGDIYEIRNLTGTNVTLFNREELAANEYTELYLNLKR